MSQELVAYMQEFTDRSKREASENNSASRSQESRNSRNQMNDTLKKSMSRAMNKKKSMFSSSDMLPNTNV